MDDKQKIWVQKRILKLDELIQACQPMTEKSWEAITMLVDSIIEQTKNNKEVQQAFFDLLERWDKYTNVKKG